MRCSDVNGVNRNFTWQSSTTWRPTEDPEDCWEQILVHETFCLGLNGWYRCNYWEESLGIDCDYIPEG